MNFFCLFFFSGPQKVSFVSYRWVFGAGAWNTPFSAGLPKDLHTFISATAFQFIAPRHFALNSCVFRCRHWLSTFVFFLHAATFLDKMIKILISFESGFSPRDFAVALGVLTFHLCGRKGAHGQGHRVHKS